MMNTHYYIPIPIIYKRVQGSLDLASPRSFHFRVTPEKNLFIENDLYFPIGIVKMRKDASFWRFLPLKFQKLKMRNQPYFKNIPENLRKDDSFRRKYSIYRERPSESYATFGFN